jgi:hypothetical protein
MSSAYHRKNSRIRLVILGSKVIGIVNALRPLETSCDGSFGLATAQHDLYGHKVSLLLASMTVDLPFAGPRLLFKRNLLHNFIHHKPAMQ